MAAGSGKSWKNAVSRKNQTLAGRQLRGSVKVEGNLKRGNWRLNGKWRRGLWGEKNDHLKKLNGLGT